jgi:hypothetical protein
MTGTHSIYEEFRYGTDPLLFDADYDSFDDLTEMYE